MVLYEDWLLSLSLSLFLSLSGSLIGRLSTQTQNMATKAPELKLVSSVSLAHESLQ
jgi:hypothetical protein